MTRSRSWTWQVDAEFVGLRDGSPRVLVRIRIRRRPCWFAPWTWFSRCFGTSFTFDPSATRSVSTLAGPINSAAWLAGDEPISASIKPPPPPLRIMRETDVGD